MVETETYMQKLTVTNPLRETTLLSAIKSLQLPLGSSGLDAGCGIGLQAILLAETVGQEGHVTGLDLSADFLIRASEIADKSGLLKRISFQEGSVNKLPFNNSTFDWAWSADCVGYSTDEPLPLIKELVRVVKPGGIVAILAWSSQQLLPGYPLLEARLNATSSGIAPFKTGMKPESHFLRALGWFRNAGLKDALARTFTGSVYAPLSDDIRNALISFFQMRWPESQLELTPEDYAEYQRLCQPESPDFILNLSDYYGFFTHSLFQGKVSE